MGAIWNNDWIYYKLWASNSYILSSHYMKSVIKPHHLHRFLLFLGFLVVSFEVSAQEENISSFEIEGRSDKRVTIPFELVNNLVVIELQINNSEPLKFILDSGVGSMLITELPKGEEVNLNSSRVVTLAGLGVDEPMKAFLSEENKVTIGKVKGTNIEVLFLLDAAFTLSNFMGMYVNGLIGFDIFNNFAVEIDYRTKNVYLYDPSHFEEKFKKLPRHRKWHQYPISIENKKPYMELEFKNTSEDSLNKIKLLIDSGSSNAFSFYKSTSPGIKVPEKTIPALIGVGLSGSIPGVMGQVEQVNLNDYTFKKPIVAYPDSLAIRRAIVISDRNGSLGGEVLRRFKVIFHYQMKSIFLRRNNNYRDDFSYNLSGMEIITPIPSLPLFVVSKVREGSVAHREGIQEGDILDRLNRKKIEDYNYNEIQRFLESEMKLSIVVDRNGRRKSFLLDLKNELELN